MRQPEMISHALFSLYDSKAEAWMTPMAFKSKGEAIRSFTEALKDPNSTIAKYPEDFSLFEIGNWDETTGTIRPHEAKTCLGTGLELKPTNYQPKHVDRDKPQLEVTQ